MGSARIILLADYLATHRFTSYELGQMDCVLFATRWIDHYSGTDTTSAFAGQYSNEIEMLEFLANIDTSLYLTRQGYKTVTGEPVSGDILMHTEPDHTSAWIVLNNMAYTMAPRGLVKIKTSYLKDRTIWRLT